jgi:hypothetical protein
MSERTHYRACCACGSTKLPTNNVVMLDKKSPTPGVGWGCVLCNLPSDGAIAVVCTPCIEAKVPIAFACTSYISDDARTPVEQLAGEHKHDMKFHQDEIQ